MKPTTILELLKEDSNISSARVIVGNVSRSRTIVWETDEWVVRMWEPHKHSPKVLYRGTSEADAVAALTATP